MVTVGVACRDQRRLTGNGSALEVVFHDDALYKSTTLLYFTYLTITRSVAAGFGRHGMPQPASNDAGTALGQDGSD